MHACTYIIYVCMRTELHSKDSHFSKALCVQVDPKKPWVSDHFFIFFFDLFAKAGCFQSMETLVWNARPWKKVRKKKKSDRSLEGLEVNLNAKCFIHARAHTYTLWRCLQHYSFQLLRSQAPSVDIYMHIHIHIYTYIYTHTHTYIYKYIFTWWSRLHIYREKHNHVNFHI